MNTRRWETNENERILPTTSDDLTTIMFFYSLCCFQPLLSPHHILFYSLFLPLTRCLLSYFFFFSCNCKAETLSILVLSFFLYSLHPRRLWKKIPEEKNNLPNTMHQNREKWKPADTVSLRKIVALTSSMIRTITNRTHSPFVFCINVQTQTICPSIGHLELFHFFFVFVY